jgi:thiamine thiazole synthase
MAVAAIYNLPRMGPIFGGMLLSGKKIAEIIYNDIKKTQ